MNLPITFWKDALLDVRLLQRQLQSGNWREVDDQLNEVLGNEIDEKVQ